jgi:hypothetical protein
MDYGRDSLGPISDLTVDRFSQCEENWLSAEKYPHVQCWVNAANTVLARISFLPSRHQSARSMQRSDSTLHSCRVMIALFSTAA